MEQVIFSGLNNTLDTSATEYSTICGGADWHATETLKRQIVSTAGKIKNLRIRIDKAAGDGKSWVFTLIKNGAPTALTVTFTGAAQVLGSDMVNEVDVVAEDAISLEVNPDSNPTKNTLARWTVVFESSTAKESLILCNGDTLSNSADEYANVMCPHTIPTITENDHREVCPTSGKIKNLYVQLTEHPGTSPDAYRFTLRKGGASQTLTVTITAPATEGNDVAHEITVAAGDVLTMLIEPLETPSATPVVHWGMTFVADIDGESISMGGSTDNLNPADTEENFLVPKDASIWSPTDGLKINAGQACTVKKLHMLLSAAPGPGKSWTFTVRIVAADSNVVVVVADAATTGNSGALEDTVINDDYASLKCVAAWTPVGAYNAYWGLVGYISPTIARVPRYPVVNFQVPAIV